MNPIDNTYTCAKCGAGQDQLQVLMAAWFRVDTHFNMVCPDLESPDLAYWCAVCMDTVRVEIVSALDGHRESYGRWVHCRPARPPIHPHVKHQKLIDEKKDTEQ